jgi:hypothetical protein
MNEEDMEQSPKEVNSENSNVNGAQQATNDNEQTKDMEVHHHPNVEKKGFKEYILEGLMIFIAVTLGFFAENLREHIKDNKEVRQSMQSLESDLKSDVAMYDSSIAINIKNCNMIDTLISLLSQKKETGKIYFLARKLTTGAGIFTPDSKTFEQLKSTGGLRLIENQKNMDSINAYYQLLKYFDFWSNLQRQRINDVVAGNDKLFDGTVFFSIYKELEKSDMQIPQDNPPLLSNDPLVINSIVIHYQYLYGILKIINRKAAEASKQANMLANLLQKEYHLENE